MVHGLPDMDYEGKFCEACVFGKQARTSFQKKAEYRAKHPLELIHTDLCGPITPESFSGKRYFISFVDDFSRKTWVFLKEKSEAFETFKKFKVFGSVAYAHIPDQRRTKLEDKSKRYIFIGYDEKTKGYKLLDPISKKVVVSRDVRVNEASEWDWNNSTEMIIEVGESSIAAATTAATTTTTTDDEDESRQPRMRSLQDLYDSTDEVHLVCLLSDAENISFEEAMRDEKWQIAMDEEIEAIDRNNTWELTDLPKGSQPIGVKWVFKKKMNAQGEIERYKARLVAKGYKKKSSWCVCHAIWLRNLLSKMMLKQADATVIHVDNKSAIELAKNPVNHERSKHIDVRFHFIRDHVKGGNVELVHVASHDQVADIFTKPLPKVLLDKCKKMIGMMDGRSI
ncbi:hypothetical protein GQ457_02G008830 [Hibiscus cannabinus]